ncbi:MAG: hypothetical protein SOZ51_03060, partial [Eubacteriales bacterium]|nr:hypothetical protein [Eubacteriales bacterium]
SAGRYSAYHHPLPKTEEGIQEVDVQPSPEGGIDRQHIQGPGSDAGTVLLYRAWQDLSSAFFLRIEKIAESP